ncbi:hypothetical protein QE109_16075 [Fusibacter bizertensis]|jgi:hypothetical protein|uniref:ECF transporter S component n=1 Tax=Fusibacter bizertensis TaxID=1488331 RepID=A0ABT6NGZ0_9FIRM|nr:hypothetical protein [Fusibacter bizertensis]MDH8679676.1 hypothetical protein [Fusibacter bizertensis]
MKAKDITLIAILSASLTAGKFVLSAVPNVEIITFLFIIYTVIFGLKRSILTSVVFTTTEILIYGFGTWLLGYYILWPILILITHVLKRTINSEYGFAIVAAIFGFLFGLFFALFESLFYGIGYAIPYWIRGIPFDIIHGVSNFIIVLVLYKPLTQTIQLAKKKMHIM